MAPAMQTGICPQRMTAVQDNVRNCNLSCGYVTAVKVQHLDIDAGKLDRWNGCDGSVIRRFS